MKPLRKLSIAHRVAHSAILTGAALTVCVNSLVALDLAPIRATRLLDGTEVPYVIFRDGARRISYDPPMGWEISWQRSASRILFRVPDAESVTASIEREQFEAPAELNPDTIEWLKREALTGVPVGAEAVEIVREERNPLLVAEKETYEVLVTYKLAGITYTKSMLLFCAGPSRITFRVSAPEAQFEKLHAQFRSSCYTWHWLPQ